MELDKLSMSDLENKYQKILSEYSRMHNIYMNDVMDFLKSEKNKYINKIIELPNGNKYYVNNSAIAREINDVNNLNNTCGNIKNIIKVDTNNLSSLELKVGEKLRSNEICKLDGKNIKVSEYAKDSDYMGCFTDKPSRALSKKLNGEYSFYDCEQEAMKGGYKYFSLQDTNAYDNKKAQCFLGNTEDYKKYGSNTNCVKMTSGEMGGGSWANSVYETKKKNKDGNKIGYINQDGILREYPNNEIKNNTGTCPSSFEMVEQSVWESFEKGKEMQIDSLCNLGNIDSDMKMNLNKMNNELIEISSEIERRINNNNSKINKLNSEVSEKRDNVKSDIININNMFKKHKNMQKDEMSINAIFKDQLLRDKSTNIEYTFWLVGSLSVAFLLYYKMK
jgi:hypothetical protein